MYRSRKLHKHYNPNETHRQLRDGVKGCPFCENPGERLIKPYEHSAVIKNMYPYQYWDFMKVTDHLMIVPNRHIESLHDLSRAERAETMDIIADYQKLGYNIYARDRYSIAKSVPHQHTHLIKVDNQLAKLFLYLRKPYFILQR